MNLDLDELADRSHIQVDFKLLGTHVISSWVAHRLSNKDSPYLSHCASCATGRSSGSLPVNGCYENAVATYSRAGSTVNYGGSSLPGLTLTYDPALAVEFVNASAYIFSKTCSMGKA